MMPFSAVATGSVTLVWNPSISPNVAGYRIYYGIASGVYNSTISAGNSTNATITSLVAGTTYYFAATAVDAQGVESPFSNETSYSVPTSPTPLAYPTLNSLPNVTINENAGLQTVNLSGITSGAANEAQTLSLTAVSSNPSLIPNPTVNYASPSSSGTLNFAPTANNYGTATVTVTVNDNGASNNIITQSFTVTVNAVNQPPTLNALPNVAINENAGLQTVNLSGITSGAANEAQALAVTAVSSNPSLIPNPTVNYASPNSTGTLNFAPTANISGTATVTVTVNDNGASNNIVTQSFTVTVNAVNQSPTLNPLDNVTVNENAGLQTVNLSGITSGAANGGQMLTVMAVSSNPGLIPNPAVNYTSPNASGTLSFTPVSGGNGTATVTVIVNDNGVSNIVSQSFIITVNAVNQAPTLNLLADMTINENAGLQTVNLSGITPGAANESQTLTVTAVSSNPGLIPNPAVSYMSLSATGTLNFAPMANISGTAMSSNPGSTPNPTVNYTSPNSTGTLSFTPTPGGYGTATVTVTVNDNGASNNIVTRSFTVTVNAVNQPPTLNALPNVAINENAGSQTVNLSGITSGAANEAQTLTVTAVSSNPGLIPNPTVNYASPNATGTLNFAPTANNYGTATVTVTVNDNGASNNIASQSFTVTVNAPAQPPTLDVLPGLTVNENAGWQTVNLSGISPGANSQGQTLTITAVSSNPGLIPDPTVNYASPNATGTLNFAPMANSYGTAIITVIVNNGGASNNIVTQSFAVTVKGANQPPTLDPLNNLIVLVNSGKQLVNLTGISSGLTNTSQLLTVRATSSNPILVPTPAISYSFPNSYGTLSFTPAGGIPGTAVISVTVNNGQLSNNVITRQFTVTLVTAVSAAKVTAALAPATPPSRGQFAVSVSGVTGYAYVVQVSTNMVNWDPVLTNTAPFTFVDTNACRFKQRYYRSFYLQ